MEKRARKLVLENGDVYVGEGFGAAADAMGEIVFNTSVAGYQEIVSDLSYTDQLIVMSYPLIGNYGITDEDYESKSLTMKALIVREYNDNPSNFRYTKTLSELLEENGVPGLSGIDTRKLVRTIRDVGSMRAALTDADVPTDAILEKLRAYEYPTDQIKRAGCKKRWYSRTANPRFTVAAIDCGIKLQMVRELNKLGCNVTLLPYKTSAEEILALRPHGLYISNGPGDPEDVPEVAKLIVELKGKLPIMGVCLGHQLISLAYGAKTYKLKFGHRGGNHPVIDLSSGKIYVTSQNHSYAVDRQSVDGTALTITHINALDNTVEGVEDAENSVFSVQFHPESAPGPNDTSYLFNKFISNMEEWNRYAEED
jgi:carbamoyl-phosphate synthase small subunit